MTFHCEFINDDGRRHTVFTRRGGAVYRATGGRRALLEIPTRSTREAVEIALANHRQNAERIERGRRQAVRKDTARRMAKHYDAMPHNPCYDPADCDCECPGCLRAWNKAGRPGPNQLVRAQEAAS